MALLNSLGGGGGNNASSIDSKKYQSNLSNED